MSKYTTSPDNEAEERAVMEWEAVNGTSPTVETKVVIRMSNSTAPTVSTDKVIRMVNGTTPTAQESEAVGGTPMVIEEAVGNGSVAQGNTGTPTASISGTPTATSGTTPTVSTDKVLWMSNGATPTVIEATNNVGPVAQGFGTSPTAITRQEANIGGTPTAFGSATHRCYAEEGVSRPTASTSLTPTVSTDNLIRNSNGSTLTVIENTGIVGPAAEVVGSGHRAQGVGSNPTVRHLRLIVCTEGTANVARSRSKTTIARTALRLVRCAEGTANVAQDLSATTTPKRLAA
jgi:hypothetical protein